MKGGLSKILGKTISGVVVAENHRNPKQQVFIVFSNGTYLEIYGDEFTCANGLDSGGVEEAVAYAEGMDASIDYVQTLSANLPQGSASNRSTKGATAPRRNRPVSLQMPVARRKLR